MNDQPEHYNDILFAIKDWLENRTTKEYRLVQLGKAAAVRLSNFLRAEGLTVEIKHKDEPFPEIIVHRVYHNGQIVTFNGLD